MLSQPEKKQLFDPGTINLVPSFITTRPHNPQRLHQELVTPFGSTATQTWQGFKKAPGRENYSKIHSKNLHNRHCTKAKPAVARHNAYRIKPQQHQFGRKQGYPLHLSQRSDPTLQWLNCQTNSITELIYWIQYVSYVLFKWQTGINNWCSPSIIISATLVTWFPSPLPTQHCGVEEHPNPPWDEPTAGGIFQALQSIQHDILCGLHFLQQELGRRRHDCSYKLVIYSVEVQLNCVRQRLIENVSTNERRKYNLSAAAMWTWGDA